MKLQWSTPVIQMLRDAVVKDEFTVDESSDVEQFTLKLQSPTTEGVSYEDGKLTIPREPQRCLYQIITRFRLATMNL